MKVNTDITTKIFTGDGKNVIKIVDRDERYTPHVEIKGLDGRATVFGFNADDALSISTWGTPYTVSNIGNDLIVRRNDKSIRFKDMAGQSININGTLVSASSTEPDIPDPEETDTVSSEPVPNITINNYITNQYITNVTTINVVEVVENHYTYNNEYNIIQNYSPNEVVVINGEYQGIDFQDNSFFIKSSVGILEIQNARDKFIAEGAKSAGMENIFVTNSHEAAAKTLRGILQHDEVVLFKASHGMHMEKIIDLI